MGGVGKRRSVTIRLVAVMVMVDLVVGLRGGSAQDIFFSGKLCHSIAGL